MFAHKSTNYMLSNIDFILTKVKETLGQDWTLSDFRYESVDCHPDKMGDGPGIIFTVSSLKGAVSEFFYPLKDYKTMEEFLECLTCDVVFFNIKNTYPQLCIMSSDLSKDLLVFAHPDDLRKSGIIDAKNVRKITLEKQLHACYNKQTGAFNTNQFLTLANAKLASLQTAAPQSAYATVFGQRQINIDGEGVPNIIQTTTNAPTLD